jgi:hypothetical protein
MEVSKANSPQVQQMQATKRATEAKQSEQRAAQAKADAPQPKEEPKPRPNVNGQGQTIGTRLSVTA